MHLVAGFVCAAGILSSTVYCFLAIKAAAHFRGNSLTPSQQSGAEPISVLKPLHGNDPGLEDNLRTFFEQEYTPFQLIFCTRTSADPALQVVERLSREYPDIPVKVVLSGEPAWPNARAFAVDCMLRKAAYRTIVVADSDVRVPPAFLGRVIQPLSRPAVGLVTCLYRGAPLGGTWAMLEALGMSVELMANVLIANMLEGMKFALGPATASTQDHIEQIGGLADTGLYYADDFALGYQVAGCGMQVVLSDCIVEHVVPRCSFRASLAHQILWMKNNRWLRPKGHVGVGLTFAMPYAIGGALVLAAAGLPAAALTCAVWGILNCFARCVAVGWFIVRDRNAIRYGWLYPLRDLLGFLVWILSWVGREIEFRGERYVLLDGGKIQRAATSRNY